MGTTRRGRNQMFQTERRQKTQLYFGGNRKEVDVLVEICSQVGRLPVSRTRRLKTTLGEIKATRTLALRATASRFAG